MSRLEQLSVGSYLIIYEGSAASTRLEESVGIVTEIKEVGPTDKAYLISRVKLSAYGSVEWRHDSIGTNQDPKFAPMSKADMLHWMTLNRLPEKIAKDLEQAKTALKHAQMNMDKLNMYFNSEEQMVITNG